VIRQTLPFRSHDMMSGGAQPSCASCEALGVRLNMRGTAGLIQAARAFQEPITIQTGSGSTPGVMEAPVRRSLRQMNKLAGCAGRDEDVWK
jgi:hypothetical protein